jgi:hypothetical protein|tara:strand:+ start:5071 stop:5652 length:582 start_codon:yes stop_codon:yes gene_type:complete
LNAKVALDFYDSIRQTLSHPALAVTCTLVYTAGILSKKRHMATRMKCPIFVVLLILGSNVSMAAIEVTQGGSGACFNVVSDLKRNWIEVKRHLLPGTENLKIPEKENFVCVSSARVRNAMETRTTASSSLRCFSNTMSNGMGFCCDESLLACAQLNPYLFPERLKRPGTDRIYEPPASIWVKPPGDDEQWKSN